VFKLKVEINAKKGNVTLLRGVFKIGEYTRIAKFNKTNAAVVQAIKKAGNAAAF
jgi:hypothetical protein